MTSYTIYKGAQLPTVSGDGGLWGGYLNTNTFPVFDSALGGYTALGLSSTASVTLSAGQDLTAILRLTGTLTVNVAITSSCQGFKLVENTTSGAYTVTIAYSGVGSAVTIPQGYSQLILLDATNGARAIGYPAATTSLAGVAQLATSAQITAMSNATNIVTPANLGQFATQMVATSAQTLTGTNTTLYTTPADIEARTPAVAFATYTTYSTITSVIPYDDTIPQNTEGTQILSVTITPKRTSNKIKLSFNAGVGPTALYSSSPTTAIAALFSSGANALAACVLNLSDDDSTHFLGYPYQILHLDWIDSPATTSAVTYAINIGCANASYTFNVNGNYSSRMLGGAQAATLIAEEIFA